MKNWWIYIIRCRDNSLYTGISNDVDKRFQTHQESSERSAKYLRGKGPLELVFKKEIGNKSLATKVENRIKRLKKSQKEALILDPDKIIALINEIS